MPPRKKACRRVEDSPEPEVVSGRETACAQQQQQQNACGLASEKRAHDIGKEPKHSVASQSMSQPKGHSASTSSSQDGPVRKYALLTFNKKKRGIQISKAIGPKQPRPRSLHSDFGQRTSSATNHLQTGCTPVLDEKALADQMRHHKAPGLPSVEQLLASCTPNGAEDLEDFQDVMAPQTIRPEPRRLKEVEDVAESWKMSNKLKLASQIQPTHLLSVQSSYPIPSVNLESAVLRVRLGDSDIFPCVAKPCFAGSNLEAYSRDERHLEDILNRHSATIALRFPSDPEFVHKNPGGAFGKLELLDPYRQGSSQFWDKLLSILNEKSQDSQMLIAELIAATPESTPMLSQSKFPALVAFRSDNLEMCDLLGVPKHSQLRDLVDALLVMYVLLRTPVG